MAVAFRNVDVDLAAPIDTWPYEALVTLIERGTIRDWAVLTAEIRRQPWGEVARQVEEYLQHQSPWGVGPLLSRAIATAREEQEWAERAEVARRITAAIDSSGLSQGQFARRIGTSASRLSTYRSGAVVPAATLLVRIDRLGGVETNGPTAAGGQRDVRPR